MLQEELLHRQQQQDFRRVQVMYLEIRDQVKLTEEQQLLPREITN